MVSEITMICVDNSDWAINGDFPPTRLRAQVDAVNLIFRGKSHYYELNTVGVLAMAGKGVRVLVTPTKDYRKISKSLQGLEVGGKCDLAKAIQVAHLALKVCRNKTQRQEIIVILGSPVEYDEASQMVGRKLWRHYVGLDIVHLREEEEEDGGVQHLKALVAAADRGGTSGFVCVRPGPDDLSNALIRVLVRLDHGPNFKEEHVKKLRKAILDEDEEEFQDDEKAFLSQNDLSIAHIDLALGNFTDEDVLKLAKEIVDQEEDHFQDDEKAFMSLNDLTWHDEEMSEDDAGYIDLALAQELLPVQDDAIEDESSETEELPSED